MSLLRSTHSLVNTHSGRWGLGVWLCLVVPTHYRLYSMAMYDCMFMNALLFFTRIWNVDTRECVRELHGHGRSVL